MSDYDRRRRWGIPISRSDLDDEVAEEIAFHLEQREKRLREDGADPRSAREEALRRFGPVDGIREECLALSQQTHRRQLRLQLLAELWHDVRLSLRGLRRRPVFALSAVLTLALGIGATTAIYSLLDAVLLRDLPYARPERLVSLWEHGAPQAVFVGFGELESLEGVGAWSAEHATLTGLGEPARLASAQVDPDFFTTLGISPLLGRGFVDADAEPGAPATVVLSERFWRERFEGDRGVLDSTIRLDGEPHHVIGIMPASLRLPSGDTQVWVPISLANPGSGYYWGSSYLNLFGRLAEGETSQSVAAEAEPMVERLRRENPIWTPNESYVQGIRVEPYQRVLADDLSGLLILLFAGVLAVLLVVCVNVAGLFLSRATARAQETAIRSSLGAGRGRLLVQSLVESWVVALVGTGVGLGLAFALLRWLPTALPGLDGQFGNVGLDGRVLLFALGLSLLTALLSGTVPALRSSRTRDLARVVRGQGSHTGAGRGGAVLVVGQLALSVVLLFAGGLLLGGLLDQLRTETEVDVERVVAASLHPARGEYAEPSQRVTLYRRVIEELEKLPTVASAAASTTLPFGTTYQSAFDAPDRGFDINDLPFGIYRHVSPGYFETLGIPLLRGRDFTDEDALREGGCPKDEVRCVAVIDQRLAQQIWPGEDPIGRTIGADWQGWFEIVGIVANARTSILDDEREPTVYYPHYQAPQTALHLAVRTRAPAWEMEESILAAVRSVDPQVPVTDVRTLADDLWGSTAKSRLAASLIGAFAAAALLLAAVGIYGVMSYRVEQRRREMGIRLALGSTARRLQRRELARTLALAGAGLALGMAAAVAALRFLGATVLIEQTVGELTVAPGILALLGVVLVGVSLLAGWLPARRASRLDPALALRAE